MSEEADKLAEAADKLANKLLADILADKHENAFRLWLIAVASLIASGTYQMAFSPPGGYWGDDDKDSGKVAGTPILLHKSPARYYAFWCGNATAFAFSLFVILLVVSKDLEKPKKIVLKIAILLDVLGLSVAYAAASCTSLPWPAVCVGLLLAGTLAWPVKVLVCSLFG
ncbi:hypothetical protein ACP70R_009057 [Stipagrostis hirtigluma subsp. patula]